MNQTATIEIIISYVVLAVIIILLKCIINTKLKLKYGKTGHETLKFETVLLKNLRECTSNFKSGIIDISRLTLLSLVISLPLIGIAIFTNLYVIFALYSLFFKAPLFVRVLPPSLLLVDAVVMQYFLSRYGTVYKLPLILLIRNDTRQSLKEHLHLYMISAIGSMVYVVAIISLLKTFVIAPGLLKIGVGIIVALLVMYVLPNRKCKLPRHNDGALGFPVDFATHLHVPLGVFTYPRPVPLVKARAMLMDAFRSRLYLRPHLGQ